MRAVAGGTVTEAGWKGGYGFCVIIEHQGDLSTLYAMLSKINVQAGQAVAAAETIALSGRAGTEPGPHLHFEVRRGGRPVDPLAYLPSI